MFLKLQKRIVTVLLSVIITAQAFLPCNAEQKKADTNKNISASNESAQVYSASGSMVFNDYIKQFDSVAYPEEEISAIAGLTSLSEGNAAEIKVSAAQSGLYAAEISYRYTKEYGTVPNFSLRLNGSIPYYEASLIQLPQSYKDAEEIVEGKTNIPKQELVTDFSKIYIHDSYGYYGGLLYFYLKEGENTVVIEMLEGDIDIEALVFKQYPHTPDYATASAEFEYSRYSGEAIYFEAESPLKKSSTSIFAINDSSSTALSPYHPFEKYLNCIGGDSWEKPGQYIEWKFTVPKDGLYSLAVKYRQETNIGSSCYRRILIDGAVPYSELEAYEFEYAPTYKNEVISIGTEPVLFQLAKGEHILRMEVAIGDIASILPYVGNVVDTLTADYRKVIAITGTAPDTVRDYHLEEYIPDVLESLEEQRVILEELTEKLTEITGEASLGTKNMTLITEQLKEFAEDSYNLTCNLSSFKTNISALTTWMLDAKMQPMKIDYFAACEKNGELKPVENGFFYNLVTGFKAFLFTFSSEYEQNQRTQDVDDAITIWMTGNSTLFQIREQMIEEEFETLHPEIDVNLRLVSENIVEAILSGVGPDLYTGIDDVTVMNLAYRDAVVDISDFKDFDEVASRFRDGAYTQVSFKDAVYGIPATQVFNFIYYRTDIFEEMGLTVPDTWDDVIYVMSMLKKSNLEFGIPFDSTGFVQMMYQMGGTMYTEDNKATALSTNAAIEAFTTFTSFFTEYGAPLSYDAINRFRSGEMPILISGIAFSLTLDFIALELQGKWDIAPYPGTMLADGTVSRMVNTDVSFNCILNEIKKDMCWEFLKWETSSKVQKETNERNEMALDLTVRSSSANVETFNSILWHGKIKEIIGEYEQGSIFYVPPVPGSYFTTRHLTNALKTVVYDKTVPAEALSRYARIIDSEIAYKYEYFDLE